MRTNQKYRRNKRRPNPTESTAQKPLQTATTGQSTARPDVVSSGSFTSASTVAIRSLEAEAFNPATPWEILVPFNLTQIDLEKDGICPSELELVIAALEHYRDFLQDGSQTASISTQIDILTDTITDLYSRVFKALSVRVDYISTQPAK